MVRGVPDNFHIDYRGILVLTLFSELKMTAVINTTAIIFICFICICLVCTDVISACRSIL